MTADADVVADTLPLLRATLARVTLPTWPGSMGRETWTLTNFYCLFCGVRRVWCCTEARSAIDHAAGQRRACGACANVWRQRAVCQDHALADKINRAAGR